MQRMRKHGASSLHTINYVPYSREGWAHIKDTAAKRGITVGELAAEALREYMGRKKR